MTLFPELFNHHLARDTLYQGAGDSAVAAHDVIRKPAHMEALFENKPPLPKPLLMQADLSHAYPEHYIRWSKCMHGLSAWDTSEPILSYGEYVKAVRDSQTDSVHSPLPGPDQVRAANGTLSDLLERYRMMPQLMQELIIDRAIAYVHCSRDELREAIRQFRTDNGCASDAELTAWLQRQQMNVGQLRNQLVREIKVEKFKIHSWGAKLESVFLARKHEFDRAIYSLIRTRDSFVAQELYFRLQDDEESFADLARQYSEGPEAQTGGLIGPVSLGNLHPDLAVVLLNGQPGHLHPPARFDNWSVIVRLEQYTPAQLDEPMRKHLLQTLYEDWLQKELAKVVPTVGASSVAA